jgi:hypothetical protein
MRSVTTERARLERSSRPRARLLAALLGCAVAGCATTPARPDLAGLSLHGLDGRAYALDRLDGRVLLLYLLTAGCDACLADQPKLRALDEKYAARGLRIALVAMDPGDGRVVRAFADSLQSPFAVLRASPELASGSSVLGPVPHVPRVLVLDAARRVVLDAEGVQAYDVLARAVETAAGAAGAGQR